jgi:hypothetical protein
MQLEVVLSQPLQADFEGYPLISRAASWRTYELKVRTTSASAAAKGRQLMPELGAPHREVTGSKPLFVMTGAAAGDIKNLMSALAASGSFALVAIPAENTVTFCTSGGSGPT